jgi:MFS family permease
MLYFLKYAESLGGLKVSMKAKANKESFAERLAEGEAVLSPPALPPGKAVSTWSVLLNRNYALLFWGQLISSAGTQMQIVAVSWQVYLLTHSAVALGAIGLLQAIPRIILSLVGGVFADVFDRRRLLLIVEVILAATSTVLAVCTIVRVINLYIIFAMILVSAAFSAFEFPARQAIIPTLVPREQMPMAMSLSMVMMQTM